ncbi:putative two component, sigma54 specific, transcriptional regulator, Fis family [Hydrogenobacter thermophilus TK-6]|uniref:Transcriptional regulator, NtrC family n=1 Tax=Hydrogenobacter thermophilus (strain DSM 6534 / IAM 12695 / TK-6) TaxID=608538 RepID=D3DJF0_HYDTT|nr:sigma-54 dependent transcriptional regulator [Hydrogenobacter thermophilus]ADO45874.1 putative two component, sigma54 specific, transcriptional regulator, Fis family [Hydrogenobacter thermophilus TK-6]BAI69952.1 transcriptional regulator, NtrC family [Hydrogenobacter thermophilus TK-6]
MKGTVLVVDDEKNIRETLKNLLEEEGYYVKTADSIESTKKLIQSEYFHTVLLDVWLPDGDGISFLSHLKTYLPDTSVIVITGHGKVEHAVRAIKDGAYDFLEKPFSMERLLLTVERAVQEVLRRRGEKVHQDELIGTSKPMLELKETIAKIAKTNINVLILGESGTGKELVARTIHHLSERKDAPFVDINCASLPDDLIEAELFGYEKGAFTSASARKQGKLELAHGGTLFLDEIGDMSLKAQAKLLRVLETKSFTRLGGTQVVHSEFRLVSASNKELSEEIKKGSFREDLYYRISAFVLYLPPLRERGEDIILLAQHFLDRFSVEYKKPKKCLTDDAKALLMAHQWRGNVRELKNLMERLVILHAGEEIKAEDIRVLLGINPLESYERLFQKDLKSAKREFEKVFIERKLREYGYDLRKVSKAINLDLSNLYRKIRQYGIEMDKGGG